MNDRELSKATSVWFWKNRRAVEKNIKLIIKNKSIIPMSVEVDEEKMIDFYRVTFDGGLELLTKQDFMDMKEGEE